MAKFSNQVINGRNVGNKIDDEMVNSCWTVFHWLFKGFLQIFLNAFSSQ